MKKIVLLLHDVAYFYYDNGQFYTLIQPNKKEKSQVSWVFRAKKKTKKNGKTKNMSNHF